MIFLTEQNNVIHNLLPNPKRYRVLRERGHDFKLPKVKSDRFKGPGFVKRCLLIFLSNFFKTILLSFVIDCKATSMLCLIS